MYFACFAGFPWRQPAKLTFSSLNELRELHRSTRSDCAYYQSPVGNATNTLQSYGPVLSSLSTVLACAAKSEPNMPSCMHIRLRAQLALPTSRAFQQTHAQCRIRVATSCCRPPACMTVSQSSPSQALDFLSLLQNLKVWTEAFLQD